MQGKRIVVRLVVFVAVFTAVVLFIEAAGVALGGGTFEVGLSTKRALIGAAITVAIFEVFQRFLPRREPDGAAREA